MMILKEVTGVDLYLWIHRLYLVVQLFRVDMYCILGRRPILLANCAPIQKQTTLYTLF